MSSSAATATTSSSSATSTMGAGSAQSSQGVTIVAFLTALVTSLVVFGVQMFAFIVLKDKLARI